MLYAGAQNLARTVCSHYLCCHEWHVYAGMTDYSVVDGVACEYADADSMFFIFIIKDSAFRGYLCVHVDIH